MENITEAQYKMAEARIEELLEQVNDNTPVDDPRSVELALMSDIVEQYEKEHYPIKEPSLADLIKESMYEMGITQSAVAKLIGVSPSRVSEYVSGKREPTLRVAREISRKLNIDPALVLGV